MDKVQSPEYYMKIALEEAKKAYDKGEVPIGAVIIDNFGKILAGCHNLCENSNSPISHAEMRAIEYVQNNVEMNEKFFSSCSIYVTVEPCPMCAYAISLCRFSALYYGCNNPKFGAVESNLNLFQNSSCHHKNISITPSICASESRNLMQNFFRTRR